MPKPNFVRIASGTFLEEPVDSIDELSSQEYGELWGLDWFERDQHSESILDLAKVLEDMYNTGIQVGIREATKRNLSNG